MTTATKITLSQGAKATIAEVFAWAAANPGKISRRGNSRRTVAYIPCGHQHFALFAEGLKPVQGRKAVAGVMLVEWLQPHEDALSIGGYYLVPSDEMAPYSKTMWVCADASGQPDVEYLTRDDGALAKAMWQTW